MSHDQMDGPPEAGCFLDPLLRPLSDQRTAKTMFLLRMLSLNHGSQPDETQPAQIKHASCCELSDKGLRRRSRSALYIRKIYMALIQGQRTRG